jgi:hypothetical protein
MKNSNKIKMIGILISLAIISPSISYADNMTLLVTGVAVEAKSELLLIMET